MKAITLWPEWCFAITKLDKRVENRTWKPPAALIGQRIAIHAGKNAGGSASRRGRLHGLHLMLEEAHKAGWWKVNSDPGDLYISKDGVTHRCNMDDITTGTIVSTAILAGCKLDPWFENVHKIVPEIPRGLTRVETRVSPIGWQAEGQYHWLLEDVQVLDKPVPAKGRMGFWEAPAEIEKIGQGILRGGG